MKQMLNIRDDIFRLDAEILLRFVFVSFVFRLTIAFCLLCKCHFSYINAPVRMRFGILGVGVPRQRFRKKWP